MIEFKIAETIKSIKKEAEEGLAQIDEKMYSGTSLSAILP